MAATPERFRIGLLGHGTVGSAFAELRPELAGVLTRAQGDFEELLAGSDLVVELIGGVEPARDYVLRAMAAGRHVVTANKQLLSQYGEELFEAARTRRVQLRFEAAVAGVVPAIRVMAETLAAAHIERVHGIVNGTTNFILTEMTRTGASYKEALRDAQELGYAEADPTEDVTGKDAAAKMAILARLAFNARLTVDQVDYDGITHGRPVKIEATVTVAGSDVCIDFAGSSPQVRGALNSVPSSTRAAGSPSADAQSRTIDRTRRRSPGVA